MQVYERLLDNPLKRRIDEQLGDLPSAFRKGRGVHDPIFTIKQFIKNRNNNMFRLFVDIEKALDSIHRKMVWSALTRRGINKKLRKSIKSIYKHTRYFVRTRIQQSQVFDSSNGTRQGGVLRPTLFTIVLALSRDKGIKRRNKKGVRGL